MRRLARLSLRWQRSDSRIAPSFSSVAALNSASRRATMAFSSATLICTACSSVLASLSLALAAASSWRLGSTSDTTSKYSTMLIAHSHRPAAARDLV